MWINFADSVENNVIRKKNNVAVYYRLMKITPKSKRNPSYITENPVSDMSLRNINSQESTLVDIPAHAGH